MLCSLVSCIARRFYYLFDLLNLTITDILILLQRIIEHFAAAAFALQATRSFDAVRIIVPSVIACIADVVMRKKATDIPSEVQLPYGMVVESA